MKTQAFIAIAFGAVLLSKASAVTPGALAIIGVEKGPAPRLALVALEPIVAGERIELLGGSEDSPTDKAVASVRFTRNLATGEIIQIAGSYCSAGTVVSLAPQSQLAVCQLIKVRSNGLEVCRTTPWIAEMGPGASYVGSRVQPSIPLTWDCLVSRDNWRAGAIPAQDSFTISATNRQETPR